MLLEYDFAVVGAANVEKALASLERRFAQHNARVNSMFGARAGGGTGARSGGRGGLASGTGGMAGAEAVREQTAMLRKLEREQIASARRVERERIASERAVGREQQKQQDYYARARQKSRERESAENAAAAAARADFVKSTVGRGFGRVTGAARAVGTAGLALTGIGGAALAGASVSQALTLDEKSRRLAISARGAGEGDAYSPAELQKRATDAGVATGSKPEDLLDATQQFVAKTGDIKTAVENMKVFATVAQATGASLTDVASTAADLSQKFDIKGTKEMGDALAVLAFQGKKGAFELKDMATEFPELAAAAQRIGLRGVGGMRTLGGLAQIARQSTGSGAEGSTALQQAFTQLTAKSGDLHSGKTLGGRTVDVFEGGDATKSARDVRQVLAEVISKSHGNVQQLGGLFDVRGIRAVSPMITAYKDAAAATNGTSVQKEAAGKAAVLKMIDDASNASGNFADVQKDAADAMKSANVEFEILSTQLKAVVAAELFPQFIQLAKELPKLIGPVRSVTSMLVKLAEVLIDHPFASLGAILAAAIAAEVLKAQIGSVLTEGVARLTGGGSGKPIYGGMGTSGANGASGAGILGAVGTGAAIGVTLATAIFTVGVANFENAEVNMKTGGSDLNRVRDAGLGDIDMVRETVKKNRDKIFELENPSITAKASNLISYGSSTDDTQLATQKAFGAEMEKKLGALDSLKDLADRLAKAGVSQEKAAAELSEAAKKLGVKMPNTGNSPSPVKP